MNSQKRKELQNKKKGLHWVWEEEMGGTFVLKLTFPTTSAPTALWLLEAVVPVQLSSGYNGLEKPCDLCMGAVSSQQLP